MNREDIIRMAREAGLPDAVTNGWDDELERFAALVAAAERTENGRHFQVAMQNALMAEREACAKVCEELVPDMSRTASDASVWDVATFDCAAAIRARGETK